MQKRRKGQRPTRCGRGRGRPTFSNLRIEMNGETAVTHSLVIATLHQGVAGVGRVQVRAIDYLDHLVKAGGAWRIAKRRHRPTMQYDALSQVKVLYKGQ